MIKVTIVRVPLIPTKNIQSAIVLHLGEFAPYGAIVAHSLIIQRRR